MTLNILLTISIFIVHLWPCNGKDIQYSDRIMSKISGDWFGESLATSHQRLVVGAHYGKYIYVVPGVKFRPPQGYQFGEKLDVNEHFIVASCKGPHSVCIFSANRPFALVGRIPLEEERVEDVKLSDNNIIVAARKTHVSIYDYGNPPSWYKHQRIVLKDYQYGGISLAVSGNIMAVGYGEGQQRGQVKIYKNVHNQYIFTVTLQPTEHVVLFGLSVAMDGPNLVVSSVKSSYSFESILFTYQFDPSTHKWTKNGRFIVPGSDGESTVSLQNDTFAATVNLNKHLQDREVCGYVYKLSNSNNHTSVSNNIRYNWKKVATLKTNGVPTTDTQLQSDIRVQDGLIFTGRMDWQRYGHGTVFVHDIIKH